MGNTRLDSNDELFQDINDAIAIVGGPDPKDGDKAVSNKSAQDMNHLLPVSLFLENERMKRDAEDEV